VQAGVEALARQQGLVRSGLDQPALLENADQIGRSASSITFIKIIGVGMIVAVILDATLAQLLLVPAGMLPMPSGRSRREPTRAELVDLAARQEIINRLSTSADSAICAKRMAQAPGEFSPSVRASFLP